MWQRCQIPEEVLLQKKPMQNDPSRPHCCSTCCPTVLSVTKTPVYSACNAVEMSANGLLYPWLGPTVCSQELTTNSFCSYQLVGVNFLTLLARSGVGGAIMADEMGLGKTAQAIAFLGSPACLSLIAAPSCLPFCRSFLSSCSS